MKIVISPDSFKGSLSAMDAAVSIDRGVRKSFPDAETVLNPIADGGEGTVDALVAATEGNKKYVKVTGPLGDPVQAKYGILGDQKTCVVEIASSSGFYLISPDKRNPMKTTTYGMGEVIKKALDDGYRSFILALGGSATNDAGAGMLQALGIRLLDKDNQDIGWGGGELAKLKTIDMSNFDKRIKLSNFLIASDVQNPLIGPTGASYVFGPQKGADSSQISLLEENLTNWADLVDKTIGMRLHNKPGAGAAGGIGGTFSAFFDAEMERGIDVVIKCTKLEEALIGADLLITGEGQVDFQTAEGKTPMGAAQAASKLGVPTIILAGSIGEGIEKLYPYGVVSIHSIINKPLNLEQAMEQASTLLLNTAEQAVRTFFHSSI